MTRDGFRLLLREIESNVAGFYTGHRKVLSHLQANQVRTYLQHGAGAAAALAKSESSLASAQA